MLQNIRNQEILEEIIEDLEVEIGLNLSSLQIKSLQLTQHLFLTKQELGEQVKNVINYLSSTPADERLWTCYQDLSDNSFIIVVCLTPSKV